MGNDYTIEVDIDGGPSRTLEWTDVTLDLAPLRLLIFDNTHLAFTFEANPSRKESAKTPNTSAT